MLSQNYPNPFNPVTLITYNIPAHSDRFSNVKLIVYNIQGKEAETIVDTEQEAGVYKVKFDASDISSGIYFYSLYINGKIEETKRMMVLK
ncbi:MAG: T9SS type A sorting domain-containing protein [Ignavibacteria bacterium]|nr:T9SS type A sorting domain-containing protein [Ignavibacteria bacterium]